MSDNSHPKLLAHGVYWYVEPGKDAKICEKREGEDSLRFMNGSRQTWVGDDATIVWPLEPPNS